MFTAAPAQAHTDEQLDEWVQYWELALFYQGGITQELFMQRWDMAERHPCYFWDRCPAPPPHTHPSPATPMPTQARVWSGTVEAWRTLVVAYFPASQVERAMRVMNCESGGNPFAKNRSSSASGLFQHLGKYWATRSAKAGWAGADIFDPTANVAVAAWLQRTGGWGHWVCR